MPLPATVVMIPFWRDLADAVVDVVRDERLPSLSTATPMAPFSCALVAGPPSPEKPGVPLPATVVMIPLAETLRMRVSSAMNRLPAPSTATPHRDAQLRAGGGPAISRVTRSGVSRDAREDSVPIQLENTIQAGEVHITCCVRSNAKRCPERCVHSPGRCRWRRASRVRRNHILLGGGRSGQEQEAENNTCRPHDVPQLPHRDPHGRAHWTYHPLAGHGHIPSRLHSHGNLHVHLHQARDLPGHASRVLHLAWYPPTVT